MKKIFYYFTCLSIMAISMISCEFEDNYEYPNANFHGTVIDAATGEGLQTQQPNGFRIKFTEVSWGDNVTPQFFWAMPDGSFNWDHLFGYDGAIYEVQPVEGAFLTPDPKTINVKAGEEAEVNFEVIPYLHIEESHSLSDNVLTINYVVTRPSGIDASRELDGSRILITNKTPFVGTNTGGFIEELSPSISITEEDLGKTITQQITLQSGTTYWMRVAARAQNPNNRWNYTPVLEINVP